MRREEVDALVESINRVGQSAYVRHARREATPTLTFDGRPQLRVLSLDPFQYQKLRKWSSPILHGQFEVVAVVPFTVNDTESVHAKAVFEAGNEMYAHAISPSLLNFIAEAVGSQERFSPR